jgi:hypothetical protein
MQSKRVFLVATLVALVTPILLIGCGESEGGSNFTLGAGGNNANQTGSVSFGIADAPVDDVKEVVIAVDKITLKKSGRDDVVIDRFTSTDLNLLDVDSFQIDLLQYQGGNQAIIIDDLELPAGSYTDLILSILDEDLNQSYVVELDDSQKIIKVPSDTLKLGGFTVAAEGVQTFTIEFNLRQAMTYRPGPDQYNLKPRGIRLQDNEGDRKISGSVDSSLFDTETDCNSKTDPTLGNMVYLYEGHDLNVDNLADVYDADDDNLTTTIPTAAIAPFAVTAVAEAGVGQWRYEFAFLPAGDYTLAFSCDAADDDPVQYDGLSLPLPSDQLVELTTVASNIDCDFPIIDDSCS